MKIPDPVLRLINEEQVRQAGGFIPNGAGYLNKLEQFAELVCYQDAKGALGFVLFYCNAPDKSISYITLIAVDVALRGAGVGRGLLNYVIGLSRQRGFLHCQLEVKKDNVRAFEFYRRTGFVEVEERGDKILMSIQLKQ